METIFDRIRRICAEVASLANQVRINYDRISPFAASLPNQKAIRPALDPGCHYLGKEEDTVAFLLTLDAVNFGSGYFPHLRKRAGMSGYFTIASALNEVYRSRGPLSADALAGITLEQCTRIFGQDPANKITGELMRHFTLALNDLGRCVRDQYRGSFGDLVTDAELSAGRLVQLLKQMPYFDDVEAYDGLAVPFYKKAQISAADLSIAFDGRRWGHFKDLGQMTIFADNLVHHVLRVDGILSYEESLRVRIDEGQLIPPGSVEEVEIRACAVHAVELIKQEMRASQLQITSTALDSFLWNRGQQPRYKAIPRHRTRTVFY